MRIINSIEDLECVIWNSQTAYIAATYYGTPSNQSSVCPEHRNEYKLQRLNELKSATSYDLYVPRGDRYIRVTVDASDVKSYVPFEAPKPVEYGVKLVVANG